MTLNEAIKSILETATLSASAANALHGATEGHPWAKGKSEQERAREALCAIAGKSVSGMARITIERAAR